MIWIVVQLSSHYPKTQLPHVTYHECRKAPFRMLSEERLQVIGLSPHADRQAGPFLLLAKVGTVGVRAGKCVVRDAP